MKGRQKPLECWIIFLSVLLVECFKCTKAFASYKDMSFGLTLPLQNKVRLEKNQQNNP